MYTCTQQGYLCTRIDLCFNIAAYLARIAVALWAPNYVLYFGVNIVFNTAANLVVAWRFRKDFPYVRPVKVTLADFRDLGIFHDLRYYLTHRISNTIYGSSDAIVTSCLAGTAQVTDLGNYTTISDSATNIGNKIMDSFAAAIGNIVYDADAATNDHDKEVFWGLDLFSYLFGSFVATAYFCLFQPFMTLWMGDARLLPMRFVLMFSLNEYVGWNHRMLGSYRAVLGRFEEDQWFMIASAVVNLALSFALFFPFGITGVVAATVVAHCIMWVGRGRVVCRHYMRGEGWRYLRTQLVHLATLALLLVLTGRVCAALGGGIVGLVLRAVVVCLLPNVLNLALYAWTKDAAYLRRRAADLWRKLKGRDRG